MNALNDQNPQTRRHAIWIKPIVAAIALATPNAVWAQAEEDAELILPRSEWKYNDSGDDLGTAWREKNFDDSSWPVGQAPLGYGDSGMNTELSKGAGGSEKTITQYFRREFDAGSPGLFFSLVLRVQRDDGIAVYINGTEVLRDNLEPDAAYDSLATSSVDSSKERAWVETARNTGAPLVAGRNVIAVEVHQSSATSSDTRFDCELFLSSVRPAYGEVRVGIQTKFTEAGNGREEFTRNPLAEIPEIEMNWSTNVSGEQFALTTDIEIIGDVTEILDENGDLDYQFYIWNANLREWVSEKIDTRNYNNVQVRVDVRTRTDGKFEKGDEFRGEVEISNNGEDFDTVKWLELKGGGEKPIEWLEAINAETTRTVMVPTSAEDPGPTWMEPGYDDSAWTSGAGGVGYETGTGYEDFIGIDLIDAMRSVNGTCYIRIPFNVADPSEFSEIQLRVRYDDGYVAFLNGVEINRGKRP